MASSRSKSGEVYGSVKPYAVTADSFEHFKADLKMIPFGLAHELLDERMTEGAHQLLTSMALDSTVQKKANLNYSLVADAKHKALEIEDPSLYVPETAYSWPAWLPIARLGLEGFMQEDVEQRSILANTVFFKGSFVQLKKLDAAVSRHAIPGGTYDNISLVMGVAVGKIVIN